MKHNNDGFREVVGAFIMGSLSVWDPENERRMRECGCAAVRISTFVK